VTIIRDPIQQRAQQVRALDPGRHRVEDIRFRGQMFVECTCGWRTEAADSFQLQEAWRYHSKWRGSGKPRDDTDTKLLTVADGSNAA
jgi:hypothetical protein